MEPDLVLGIDCSTTASKAVAWDASGNVVAEGRVAIALLTPRPGWGEQDARKWWTATAGAIRQVTASIDPLRIAALCITHQRESFVPVDVDGAPLRHGILWLDERSRPQLATLDRQFGHAAIHTLTGRPPSLTQALPKLLWLQEQEPDVLRQAARIVDVHAFLVHALSGEWATSLPSGDPLGIVDQRQGDWAEALITGIDLRLDQFVPIVPAGTRVGIVSSRAATETGLRAGTPIVAGAGDGQAASLGAGVTSPGRAFINLGTAIASGAVSDRYVTNLAFRTCAGAIPGTYVLESVLRGGTATVTWFMDHFADPSLAGDPFDHYEAAAAELPPGAEGLMLVPYWNTVMNPYWDPTATGLVLGWTTAHRRHHLYRAILEGIIFEQRLAFSGIAAASGVPIAEHVILGGGSQSNLWGQIAADVLATHVQRARTADATNLGAAVLAAWACNWYSSPAAAAEAMTTVAESFAPGKEARAQYEVLYSEVYVHLFPAIRPVMDRLTALTAGVAG